MIILSSSHKELMKVKDSQIADLKEQVRFLRDMVQPSSRVQLVSTQANAVLDGLDEIPSADPVEERTEHQQNIDSEAARLLSGNY